MANLTIVNGANVGRSYELGDRELVIGRDPMCEIVVPVRTVSRQHARVGSDVAGFYVEDLGSVNGTYINGRKLEGRARLDHRDRVRISQNVFQFFAADSEEQTVMLDAAALKPESSGGSSKLHRKPTAEEVADQLDDEDDSRMPRIVSSVAASVSQLGASINPQEKLQAVLEITQSLGSSLDLDEVLPEILESLFRLFPQTSHGYILQAPRVGAPLEPIAIKHRNSDSDTISPLGGPIVSRVMAEGAAFLSSPVADDDSVLDDGGPTSVMCAPLMGPAKTPLGVIHLDTMDAKHPFDQSDLEMLVAVGTVAGQSVEYARMHSDILELDRQKRDLATAQDVQLHFLPQVPPEAAGYKFYDYYRAASTVAGDYYDYIPLPDGRLAIAIGDVAGKGVPAALLMARLCSDVRYSLLTHDTPAKAINALNKQLTSHLRPGRFITFVLFVLDPARHTLSIVNAGHTPPLLRELGSRSITPLAGGEMAEIPLGIKDDVLYPQSDLQLEPGDVILTYTDGVNEAINPGGDLYSNQRAEELLSTAPDDAMHVGQALVADVRSFSGGLRQSDDICLLCFGRLRYPSKTSLVSQATHQYTLIHLPQWASSACPLANILPMGVSPMIARLPFALFVLSLTTVSVAQDWNQWRGPNRDGYLPASPALIQTLPPDGLSPVWMSEADLPSGGGGGWSSPVVAGDRVFVFTHIKSRRQGVILPKEKYPKLDDDAREKLSKEAYDQYEQNRREEQQVRRDLEYQHEELLVCFDAKKGDQIWNNKHASRRTRYAQSSSPAVFGGVAYVHGARGAVRAIDVATGKDIWKLQLPGEFDDEPHPASVAAAGGIVIVVASRLFGIDAETGKVLWQGEDEIRGDDSSPAIWRHGDDAHVVAHVGKETVCLAAKDGKELWRVESLAGRSSPVVVGDRLITYGNSRKGGVRCFVMSPDGAELAWTNTDVADEGSSPVVVDDHVYAHGDRRLVCIDLASGKSQWRRELDLERPRYTSLIAADGKIIFAASGLLCIAAEPDQYRLLVNGRFDREGRVASEKYFRELLKMDELEQTAEGQKQAESLWRQHVGSSDPAQCVSPAMADGKIYLRLKNNRLACYDLRVR